jgi:crotonobetainyl-CoA:carnitine CoA-transferase CaiB-like acyl-CoA transferase
MDAATVLSRLEAAGVPAAPVRTSRRSATDEQRRRSACCGNARSPGHQACGSSGCRLVRRERIAYHVTAAAREHSAEILRELGWRGRDRGAPRAVVRLSSHDLPIRR